MSRILTAHVVLRRDVCSRCLYLGIFSKWASEAREAGDHSRGSTERKESRHRAGGENPTMEGSIMGSSIGNCEEGPKGTRKREEILSQSAREEGVLRRWEVAMVLKTQEARGQK